MERVTTRIVERIFYVCMVAAPVNKSDGLWFRQEIGGGNLEAERILEWSQTREIHIGK